MDGEWCLKGCREMYINTDSVIDLIKVRNTVPEHLHIDEIAHKELDSINISGARYIAADTRFPVLVVEGMQNPYNKKYRLIDGRHRLLKTIREGKTELRVYVVSESDVMQFCNYL